MNYLNSNRFELFRNRSVKKREKKLEKPNPTQPAQNTNGNPTQSQKQLSPAGPTQFHAGPAAPSLRGPVQHQSGGPLPHPALAQPAPFPSLLLGLLCAPLSPAAQLALLPLWPSSSLPSRTPPVARLPVLRSARCSRSPRQKPSEPTPAFPLTTRPRTPATHPRDAPSPHRHPGPTRQFPSSSSRRASLPLDQPHRASSSLRRGPAQPLGPLVSASPCPPLLEAVRVRDHAGSCVICAIRNTVTQSRRDHRSACHRSAPRFTASFFNWPREPSLHPTLPLHAHPEPEHAVRTPALRCTEVRSLLRRDFSPPMRIDPS